MGVGSSQNIGRFQFPEHSAHSCHLGQHRTPLGTPQGLSRWTMWPKLFVPCYVTWVWLGSVWEGAKGWVFISPGMSYGWS